MTLLLQPWQYTRVTNIHHCLPRNSTNLLYRLKTTQINNNISPCLVARHRVLTLVVSCLCASRALVFVSLFPLLHKHRPGTFSSTVFLITGKEINDWVNPWSGTAIGSRMLRTIYVSEVVRVKWIFWKIGWKRVGEWDIHSYRTTRNWGVDHSRSQQCVPVPKVLPRTNFNSTPPSKFSKIFLQKERNPDWTRVFLSSWG